MRKWAKTIVVNLVLVGCAQTETTEDPASTIKVAVSPNEKECRDPAYPLAVRVTNNNNNTLASVDLMLAVYEKGRSSTLWAQQVSSDVILKPDYEYTLCYGRYLGAPVDDIPLNIPAETYQRAVRLRDVPRDQLQYEATVENYRFSDKRG